MNHQIEDTIETLDYADRWMMDGFSVVKRGDFFGGVEVDMSQSNKVIKKLQDQGIKASYAHIYIRATAIILSRYPALRQLIDGNKRVIPGQVDIGLSVKGSTVAAPVLVIRNADNKTIDKIAQEVIERLPQVRKEDLAAMAKIRKTGRFVPFSWMRRLILGQMMSRLSFRRKSLGIFQVSCVPNIDFGVPFLFAMSAILLAAEVRDRVIVIDGKPEVRPTVMLCSCADHKVWDGVLGSKFVSKLKRLLESDELLNEF